MKKRLATVWLDGCSGCHMSFLDMDERLIELAGKVDLVYSPLVDTKEFPPDVDITLVEGAVSSEEDLHKIQVIRGESENAGFARRLRRDRQRPRNAQSHLRRFPCTTAPIKENVTLNPGTPTDMVPALLPYARPVHEVVKVDVFIPGCPPSADVIYYALTELLEGRQPDLSPRTRFGA